MRSIGTLAVVTGLLLLAPACSGDGDGGITPPPPPPPPENAAPVANFTVPACSIDVDCDFVSTSTDDTLVTKWSWDFNGDGTADATTANATYRFTTAGDFNISLTVEDAQGLSNTKTSPITIDPAPPVNAPPAASFTKACNAAVCTFLSTSTDVAPGTIESYAWTFGDGGTADVNNPSHTYSPTVRTDYTVTLTVTDNEGATDSETQTVTVDPVAPANQPPSARFIFSCAAATCTFLNSSFDHGGRIESSAWTFGDGGTSSETSPSHTYEVTAATDFTVTLTVTDNEGATGVTQQTFTLDPTAANIPPTAGFVPNCYGEGCIFNSTSTDAAPGKIVSYAWDFGDGTTSQWDNWVFPKHLETHVYNITARTSFTVTLKVTDNEGATAVATQTVTRTPLPPAVQGCSTSGRIVECVLDIPSRSTLRVTLNGVSCDLVEKISTPPPVGDQMFLTVCKNKVGDATGIFGGTLDELWVYQAGSQARIWFTQDDKSPRPLNPPAGHLDGTYPDWTLSFEDGDHPGAPGEPDFTDIVVGVHATAR